MKKRRVGNIKVVVNVVIKSKGKKVMNKRLKSCKGYNKSCVLIGKRHDFSNFDSKQEQELYAKRQKQIEKKQQKKIGN